VRNELRDNQPNDESNEAGEEYIELPTCYSKRSLYNRLLQDCNWSLTLDAKGRVKQLVPALDSDGNAFDPVPIPSWAKFHEYWRKNYPKLVIQKPSADICGDCYIFANQHKYASSRKNAQNNLLLQLDEEEDDEGFPAFCNVQHQSEGDDDGPSEADMLEQEQRILQAAEHVKAADAQRKLFQSKIAEAVASKGLAQEDQVLTYVGDYSQNLQLPHYASEQPGETYYYCPVNYYAFGIIDCATAPNHLAAYVYSEADGSKGGNNVSSFMWTELQRRGLINPDWSVNGQPVKEINFVFDNCGGQNKNRMVLRMLLFLVNKGICQTARAIFLVRGHTKNACDRMFNLLKTLHRKKNTYIPRELIANLNSHKDVTVIDFDNSLFFDFDEIFDKYMTRIQATKINHIFSVYDTTKHSLWKQLSDGTEAVQQVLVRQEYRTVDWAPLILPKRCPVPGMADIKWKELYYKWRPLIPADRWEHWDYLKYKPDEKTMAKVKEHTKESKKQRVGRSRTGASKDEHGVL
jgi:hypothetical protein